LGLLTDLKQKLEKGIESTSQRSKKVLDISRITLLIRSKKESEEELYQRLGREIYRYWDLKGRLDLTDLTRATIGQIKEVREKIDELEQTLEELKKRQLASEADRKVEKALTTEQVIASRNESTSPSSTARNLPDSDPEPTPASDENWAEGQAIFFCSHCGNQVDEDTIICPHCKQNIYD
jgi:hypothetical protein